MAILKGGYLAVCSFFALSGYLSAKALEKRDFSIAKYYKDRLFRVYIPMAIVVLCALGICLVMLPDVVWVSMKREVFSLLFGYNNFWQIGANADYFARHIDSPYMHLWYIAILIQLDLIFPLLLKLLEYVQEKISDYAPAILVAIFGIGSFAYFLYLHQTKGLMSAYYNTFARAFSWFFGMAVGIMHEEGSLLILNNIKDTVIEKTIFPVLIAGELVLCVFVSAGSSWYLVSMILITVFTCRLFEYAKSIQTPLTCWVEKVTRGISAISYEIYLVQYPVIYLFQYANLPRGLKCVCIIFIVLLISALMHAALNLLTKKTAFDVISFILLLALLAGSVYGGYRFVTAKDLKKEMEQLEKEMEKEKEEQEKRKQEYEATLQLEEEQREQEETLEREKEKTYASIDERLEEIERKEDYYWESSKSARITFVGDSVMLGAATELCDTFPSGYVDAEKNRTGYAINTLVAEFKKNGILGNQVVISCGANGDCPESVKDSIMATLEDKEVFWLTTPNNPSANETLKEYASRHDNLYVIDWAEISAGHSEYFAGDGLHLASEGKPAFAQAIRQGIYDAWVEELELEKQDLLQQKADLEK